MNDITPFSTESDLPFDPYDDPRPAAKAKMLVPGIGLIVIGVLCVLSVFYAALASGHAKTQLQSVSRQMQKQDGMSAQQKKFVKDFFDVYERYLPVMIGIQAVVGAAIAIGGYQMITLSARFFCFVACAMSFIPIATGFCCCLGLIFGVWGIFMLNMPDVRAGFAMQAYVANRKKTI